MNADTQAGAGDSLTIEELKGGNGNTRATVPEGTYESDYLGFKVFKENDINRSGNILATTRQD